VQVRLSQYYVHPHSTPTRAALLTGQYAHAGAALNADLHLHCPFGLRPGNSTLGVLFQRAGYATALVGSWQLGRARPGHSPLAHGFDTFVGTHAAGVSPLTKQVDGAHDLWRDRQPWTTSTEHLTPLVASEARRILAEHARDRGDQPLFLFLSFAAVPPAPHTPASGDQQDPCASLNDDARRRYCAMLRAVDAAVGAVVADLQARQWWAATTAVLTSTSTGNPWQGSYNTPFRGGDGSLWEGGVRGVALVRSPALRVPAGGRDVPALAHVADWLRTLPTLAGVPSALLPPRRTDDDGWDLSAALAHEAGASSLRTEAVLALDDALPHSNRSALRMGRWKLVLGRGGDPRHYTDADGRGGEAQGLRSTVDTLAGVVIRALEWAWGADGAAMAVETVADLRYYFNMGVRDPSSSGVFLYDVEADPEERYDVADRHRAVVRAALDRLATYRARRPVQLDPWAVHARATTPTSGVVPGRPADRVWAPYLGDSGSDAALATSADVSTPPVPIARLRRQLRMSMNIGFVAVLFLTYRYGRRRPAAAPATPAAAPAARPPVAGRALKRE
jgi:arylsulfatase A-like enzyme